MAPCFVPQKFVVYNCTVNMYYEKLIHVIEMKIKCEAQKQKLNDPMQSRYLDNTQYISKLFCPNKPDSIMSGKGGSHRHECPNHRIHGQSRLGVLMFYQCS